MGRNPVQHLGEYLSLSRGLIGPKNDASESRQGFRSDGGPCQQLAAYAALVDKNSAAFDRIDFDFETAKEARALATDVLKGHAAAAVKKASSDKKDIRNRAYTYLNEAVDDIRAAGLFAFRRDRDASRVALFRSAYALRAGRKHRARTAGATPPTSSAPAASVPDAPSNRVPR